MNAISAEERSAGTGGKVMSAVREAFTNWRLALLGLTGLILSLASGWTTWDGMSNFTCPQTRDAGFCFAPRVLSFMVTFGIQGIMLIAAWLIGETFASSSSMQRSQRSGWFTGGLLAAASIAVLMIFVAVMSQDRFEFIDGQSLLGDFDWTSLRPGVGAASLGVAIIALFIVLSRREIAGPYIEGTKTILRNVPLWIMFLACMGTSVFFSFDSLFSTIFPQTERVRAAKLRVENQVAGVLSDVQAQLVVRRLDATRALFASSQWQAFNGNLDTLVAQAEAAPEAVQKQKLERVARSNQALTEVRGQVVEANNKARVLNVEKDRLKRELESVNARTAPHKARIAQLDEQLILKRAEMVTAKTAAEGELRGVRGTGNAGAGPEYRKLLKIVQNLQLDVDELATRLRAAQDRVARVNDETTATQQRITEIDKALAVLDVTKAEASQRQEILNRTGQNALTNDLDAAGGIRALEVARNKFRRAPEEKGLDQLEQLCTSLLANLRSVASLKAGTANVNCEPGDASVLANAIFRLKASEASYRATCIAGENIPRGSANKLLNFGSVCIQNSGLPGSDTEQFRGELNRIALNRDDKAHRFVVSWNAFNDGNALAYLALAIAFAIDGLVFMSGLFGANVIRSPLSAVSSERLVATIDKALGSDKYESARQVLKAIADKPDAGFGSFRHQVVSETAEQDPIIKNVLAAGMGLNAVRWDGRSDRYLVHADFTTYLNQIAMRTTDDSSELRKVLSDALAPDVAANADMVLHEIEPDSSQDGFMGYVRKPRAGEGDTTSKPMVVLQRALSAGTSLGVVQTTKQLKGQTVDEVFYWIRPPFWACVADLRAGGRRAGLRGRQLAKQSAVPAPYSAPPLPVPPSAGLRSDPNNPDGGPVIAGLANDAPPQSHAAKATIDIAEQDRQSSIRDAVRQTLVKSFQLDDIVAKQLLDDANIAVDTFLEVKALPGAMAEKVAREIEATYAKLIDNSQPIVDQYHVEERLAAEEERDTIVLAEAARRTSTIWRQMASSMLESYIDLGEIHTDDRTFQNPTVTIDRDLTILKESVLALQSHDRFDRTLVTLLSDSDKAWEKLLELQEDESLRPPRQVLNS